MFVLKLPMQVKAICVSNDNGFDAYYLAILACEAFRGDYLPASVTKNFLSYIVSFPRNNSRRAYEQPTYADHISANCESLAISAYTFLIS